MNVVFDWALCSPPKPNYRQERYLATTSIWKTESTYLQLKKRFFPGIDRAFQNVVIVAVSSQFSCYRNLLRLKMYTPPPKRVPTPTTAHACPTDFLQISRKRQGPVSCERSHSPPRQERSAPTT